MALSHKDAHRCWHVKCVCECGTVKTVKFSSLSSSGLQSCGCLLRETAKANALRASTTHGLAGSPTYRSWAAMIQRCTNVNHNRRHIYLDAGVTVCSRWLKFEAFLADMGERPRGASLDRYPDANGNYEPGNCRWATSKEQALNRSTTRWFEYDGTRFSLKDLAEHVGMKRITLLMRLKRGWSLEKAINTPLKARASNDSIKPRIHGNSLNKPT